MARRYDDALRPLGLTSGQFSLMMALSRPAPPTMGEVAHLLAMDRTTLTANLKPLERRGLVEVTPNPADKRSRRMALTPSGREILAAALPLWRDAQSESARLLGEADPQRLLADLRALS
jgi:DNA-binding MarR family transcriptional regulator